MLESMISSPVPTRAEVSDVANAVYEGADAVMLSAETAAGAYPTEAVAVMDRIARAVEADSMYRGIMEAQRQEPEATMPDAILAAVHDVTHTIKAAAIVCWTKSGSTGLRAARERPEVPILALTPSKAMARRLTLAWGLHCVETEDAHNLDDVSERACQIAFAQGFAKMGDRVVITAGLAAGHARRHQSAPRRLRHPEVVAIKRRSSSRGIRTSRSGVRRTGSRDRAAAHETPSR